MLSPAVKGQSPLEQESRLKEFLLPYLLEFMLQPRGYVGKLDVLVCFPSLLTLVNQLLFHALVAGMTRPKVKVTELDHGLGTPR
jgi:hypothetical protein